MALQKLCLSTTEKSQSITVNKQPCFRIYYSELFLLTSPSLQLFNSGISRKKHILSCHKTSYLKPHHATSGQKKSQDPTLSKRRQRPPLFKMSQALFVFREHVKSHLYYAIHETSQRDRSGFSNTSTDPGSFVSLLH